MSLKDANNAIKVKEKFGLDYEPACVFIHRRDRKTRVEFGDLKSDLHYHLEDPNKIADQTSHARNALWMSKAAYADNPADALQETIQKHTIHTIHAVSNPKHCDQGVILAVGRVNNKDTLYVAYRGTTTWSAAIADADIALQTEPGIPGGRIHSGFSKRSKRRPGFETLSIAPPSPTARPSSPVGTPWEGLFPLCLPWIFSNSLAKTQRSKCTTSPLALLSSPTNQSGSSARQRTSLSTSFTTSAVKTLFPVSCPWVTRAGSSAKSCQVESHSMHYLYCKLFPEQGVSTLVLKRQHHS